MARIINLIILVAEIISLAISLNKKEKPYIYYTQISNSICMASSLLLVIFGLRMPVEIIIVVLLPMLKTVRLFTGRNFVLHIFCPILSIFSYLFLENHVKIYFVAMPLIITLVYGIIMIILNAKEKVKGPYPFFEIKKNGVKATVIWIAIVLVFTGLISAAVGMAYWMH